jgi:hypothetical protein
MQLLTHEERSIIVNDDERFRMYVMEALGELRNDVKSVVGNGQPGRLSNLEKRVARHEWFLGLAIGGAAVVGYLLSYGVSLAPIVFGK